MVVKILMKMSKTSHECDKIQICKADCVGKMKKRQKNEVRMITKKDGEDRTIITTVLLCKKGETF